MRHVFIVNPTAGKHADALKLLPEIQACFADRPEDCAIHITAYSGHATSIAKKAVAQADTPVRLYSCGGDGTLLEVVTGLYAATGGADAQVELAVVPCGSGNDFIKVFGTAEAFRNLPNLIAGTSRYVDGIRCLREGKEPLISLNICSMGMDAKVAYKMEKYKHWPLVSGSMAYNLALVDVFFHRLGDRLQISLETDQGPVETEGTYLLVLAANGQYYGGGYHGAPQAVHGDGQLDFLLVEPINRLQILRFLPRYKAGQHLGLPFIKEYRGTKMTIRSGQPVVTNMDGECFTETTTVFEVVPNICKIVLPAGE